MKHAWGNEANLVTGTTWTCSRCGSSTDSRKEPAVLDGFVLAWAINANSYGKDLRVALSRGFVRRTPIPADCDEAMVLNVMES